MDKILQITSGRGPAECCWVVAQVLKIILEEATAQGFTCSVMHREAGPENRTLLSASVKLSGKNVATFTKGWTGTVQWTGQSQFRKTCKRKNWYVGVEEIDMAQSVTEINDSEITYQAIRAGGPGGQHVNKVSTAIRATHTPTNVSVHVSESRSQLQNRKIAKIRLQELLSVRAVEEMKTKLQSQWNNHKQLQRGNSVRVFKGTDFKVKKEVQGFKTKRQELKNQLRNLQYE